MPLPNCERNVPRVDGRASSFRGKILVEVRRLMLSTGTPMQLSLDWWIYRLPLSHKSLRKLHDSMAQGNNDLSMPSMRNTSQDRQHLKFPWKPKRQHYR